MRSCSRLVALLAALLVGALALPAAAHPERDTEFPLGDLDVPSYRFGGPTLVVCKDDTAQRLAALPAALRERNEALLDDCAFAHIQDAVNAVAEQGSRILVLPGVYREEPYIGRVPQECEPLLDPDREPPAGGTIGPVPLPLPGSPGEDDGDNTPGSAVLTYDEQRACPHVQNLIAIFGDSDGDGRCDNALCDLQIEGTGARPQDVVVDGDFGVLNGLRADRADGLYLRNFTVQRFEFNAVYVLETDGFAFDEMLTRWNDEYGFLSFAVDHGLYQNCEAHGNGDSGIYPGSASDLNEDAGLFDDNEDLRFATEIRGCRSHHNTLGYSGTAGNSVHTHHNEMDGNITGFATDSLFPDHPGLPQDHAYVHDNLFHSNNSNYYRYVQEGHCTGPFADRDYDDGVVCPVVPLPVGSGLVLAGGNHNLFERNQFYDNWRQGVMQFFVPAFFRGEEDPTLQFDTSNFNTTRDNVMGANPAGHVQANGVDLWWDGEGEGNCWSGNAGPAGDATSSVNAIPLPLPGCDPRPPFSPAVTIVTEAGCVSYDRDAEPEPPGCDWFQTPTPPADRQPLVPTIERVAGADRIATAVAVAREAFPDRAQAVVLARADDYPDALAGAPLAEAVGGPILLTGRDALDDAVAAEIVRLGPARVLLLGGERALGAAVAEDVADLGVDDVVRVAGADRYATSVAIARLVGGANAYVVKGADDDPGRAWPDALSASAVAAHQQRPILLTDPEALPPVVAAFLDEGLIAAVRVVGGEAAVAPAVEAAVAARVRDVVRVAGSDRYATSLALAEAAEQAGADVTGVWLATGADFPDALAAGPAAAVDEGVLVLVDPAGLSEDSPTAAWLQRHETVLENVRVLGGEAAIPSAVVDEVIARTGAVPGDVRGDRSHGEAVTSGRIAAFDGAPQAYADLTGHARMLRTVTGTTRVEVLVAGLPADTRVPVHVHAGSCAEDQGGPHFAFDAAGPALPPNEIHPSFTTDAVGVGRGVDTAYAVAGPEARAVVLHTPEGDKVGCADLAGAVIEAGTAPQVAGFMLPGAGSLDRWLLLALVALLGAALAMRGRRVLA